jgi:hypothetical protein
MNIYVELTQAFNANGLNVVLSSGQAVVLHKLAVASKDGDWLVREDQDALDEVLAVLASRGAFYRFGAPYDLRWMRGGWSSHFEFREGPLRIRTDFVTRPPRLSPRALESIWREQSTAEIPIVDPKNLAELKKTNREKDYAIIGELARLIADPADQMLVSRSARDITAMAVRFPELVPRLVERRPALSAIAGGLDALEAALDAERRRLIHANEQRLQRYLDAAEAWKSMWPSVAAEIAGMPLFPAHRVVVERATGVVPFLLPQGQ